MSSQRSEVDWSMVLGPALSPAGIPQSELGGLDECVFQHARRSVRPHLQSAHPLPFETLSVPWFPAGQWLADSNLRPGAFLQHAVGDYYVQDAGFFLALALCDVQPGQTVVDTCASPGGKATALLEMLGGQGALVANEVIASRLAQLQIALERTGLPNFIVSNEELENIAGPLGGQADLVLVDAPCSGQSMVAKGKQSLSSFAPVQIEHNAARQAKLFEQAAKLVRPGGRLVYSTCTFSFAENEAIIAKLLEGSDEWSPVSKPRLAQWESQGWPGCYRLWPHRDDCAGAFAAALQRSDSSVATETDLTGSASVKSRKSGFEAVPSDALPAPFADWALSLEDLECDVFKRPRVFRRGNKQYQLTELLGFPKQVPQHWLQVAYSGSRIAESSAPLHSTKPPVWEPCFASAKLAGKESSPIELSDDQAASYVAGESVRIDSALKGWLPVAWEGRRLSWGKLVGGVLKNHFPKNLRQQVV